MIFIAVLIIVACIAALIIIKCVREEKLKKGDYDDGGGNLLGGNNSVDYFAPITERRGVQGEKETARYLRALLRNDEYLLCNLLLPLKNGHKTEVDAVIVSRRGIFCIEIKTWVGNIYGNEEDDYWEQVYDDKNLPNRTHKNPFKQNEIHCKSLNYILNDRFDICNIVILSRCDSYYGDCSDCFDLRDFMHYYRNDYNVVLTVEEVKQISQKLQRYIATEAELEQHKKETYNHYNN